ncbi:MAG: tRNA (N6-isopentenyl adenosine(37)-C2)-methylthiotransferase MiaB [bacterium]
MTHGLTDPHVDAPTPGATQLRAGKYYLQVYGCQMNQYEAGLVRAILDDAGFEETTDETDADAYAMLTCAVRSHAEARALGRLSSFRALRRERAGRVIAVLGCVSEHARDSIVEDHGADVVLGPDQYRLLPAAIAEAAATGRTVVATGTNGECYDGIVPRAVPAVARSCRGGAPARQIRGSVTVMRGCDNWCSYCIVPLTRGRERSRPKGRILDEVRSLVGNGVLDVTLLGQNVLAYRDGATGFPELVETVAGVPGLLRLRFLTSHPRDLSPAIARLMAVMPAVCPDLHLPVQSGSDRILKLMKRGYTRAEYLSRVETARSLVPELGLTTDILVGFPGESDEDYLATLDLVRQVRFESAYMFRYSARPGTEAAKMGPKVAEAEAGSRLARLIELQNRITREKNRELIGREIEVLIEAPAPRGEGMLGRARNNRTVIVEGTPALGELVTAAVTGVVGWTPVGRVHETAYPLPNHRRC